MIVGAPGNAYFQNAPFSVRACMATQPRDTRCWLSHDTERLHAPDVAFVAAGRLPADSGDDSCRKYELFLCETRKAGSSEYSDHESQSCGDGFGAIAI
jgi:hypothetical protein